MKAIALDEKPLHDVNVTRAHLPRSLTQTESQRMDLPANATLSQDLSLEGRGTTGRIGSIQRNYQSRNKEALVTCMG